MQLLESLFQSVGTETANNYHTTIPTTNNNTFCHETLFSVTFPINCALPITVVVIGRCSVAVLGHVHYGQPATNTCNRNNIFSV